MDLKRKRIGLHSLGQTMNSEWTNCLEKNVRREKRKELDQEAIMNLTSTAAPYTTRINRSLSVH